MILISAPYGGQPPENSNFLAAAKKIRFIINILAKIDSVVLINSAPKDNYNEILVDTVNISGDAKIKVITPKARKNIWLGRVVNLLEVPEIVNFLHNNFGAPDVVWCYNAYAFELTIARYCKKKYDSRVVLEFEDWHFARSRGLNPKPFVDWFIWKRSRKVVDYAFVVNSFLEDKLKDFPLETKRLPGVLSESVLSLQKSSPPFKDSSAITVGYFGGLNVDKGAGFLMDLIEESSLRGLNINFVVTGKGQLSEEFYRLSCEYSDSLSFMGAVSDEKLVSAISEVDVIVNPHVVNEGVFPFKITEAIASGRLVITTPLTDYGSDGLLEKAVVFCDLDIDCFLQAIVDSPFFYDENSHHMFNLFSELSDMYSANALREKFLIALERKS
ncbi:glycosyltransferase family 4 protein [Halomonas urmiana]|uniref:Glycosyltransferase family 4 protein n=1 Tax=Halomonas urmiana TaxID=490901 RepID=A0A5R8M8Q4_9GAMM|nr:glycosyltransferase [Halomonas urmiana]TLF45906.1 glycosyltransferase family 4 protein [Halomonas urmiana]